MIQCSHCQKLYRNPPPLMIGSNYTCQVCGSKEFVKYEPQWSYLAIPVIGTIIGFILLGIPGAIFGCVSSLFFIERDK